MKGLAIIITIFMFCSSLGRAQYIAEVLDYRPAPGQHINAAPWGLPSSAGTIIGGTEGALSLGAFGGFVVFAFGGPVENHPGNPYGVDFTVFGNPVPGISEPGMVYVMNDQNGNGMADDTWYLLAGSDYRFPESRDNYVVTYFNPGGADDVPWTDNLGNDGFIFANAQHEQPYYPSADSFPAVDPEQYTLLGHVIRGAIDTTSPAFIRSTPRAFGYADNRLRGTAPWDLPDNPYTYEKENSGGDAFDISWAVDSNGSYVDLDRIHFVKVQTGMMGHAGWLGEISTEITGAVDVSPDPGITGVTQMVVIDTSRVMLYAYAFQNGRPRPDAVVRWEASVDWATVWPDGVLVLTGSGELELTAMLDDNPGIRATASCTVELPAGIVEVPEGPLISLYPNPAGDHIRLLGIDHAGLAIFSMAGEAVRTIDDYQEGQPVSLEGLAPGAYVIRISGRSVTAIKFIRR